MTLNIIIKSTITYFDGDNFRLRSSGEALACKVA